MMWPQSSVLVLFVAAGFRAQAALASNTRCVKSEGQIVCGPEHTACVEVSGAIVCGESVPKQPVPYSSAHSEESALDTEVEPEQLHRSGYTHEQIGMADAGRPVMKYRQLGKTGLRVSVLGYGSWISFKLQFDEDMAYHLMKYAFESGCNFFDTAETYAAGEAEVLMGAAISKGIKEGVWQREDLVISTKVFWGRPITSVNKVGLSRKHIIEGVEQSLRRLHLDYADIVFAHRPDVRTPIEETVRAFNFLIDQGKIMYWGTSMWSSTQIAMAQAVADRLNLVGPAAEQPEYSLLKRDRMELEYVDLFSSSGGLGTTIYSPLALGVLTGKYNNGIPEGSRFTTDDPQYKQLKDAVLSGSRLGDWDDLVAKIQRMTTVADSIDATPAQLALAWCLKNTDVSTVILGATNTKQLEENFGALKILPRVSQVIMAELDDIFGNKPQQPVDFVDVELKKIAAGVSGDA